MSARDIGAIKARAVPIRAAQQRSGNHGEAVDQDSGTGFPAPQHGNIVGVDAR